MVRSLVLLSFLHLFVPTAHAEFAVAPPDPGPRPGVKTPHVTRAGEPYVVVWTERHSLQPTNRLAAALVDEHGRSVRSFAPVPLAQGLPAFPGTIAASAGQVLLPGDCIPPFFTHERSVCVSWLDLDDGSISAPQVIEQNAVAASAAWNGREFLLTYAAGTYGSRELRARRISADGLVHPAISLGPWNDVSHTPSTAADGDSFYVAWYRRDEVSLLTEIVDGEVRRSIPIAAPTQQEGLRPHLSVMADRGEVIIVTGEGRYRIFRGGAAVGPWQSIGRSSFEVFHPRGVRMGQTWAIVFATSANQSELRAVPVNVDGTPGAEVSLNATAEVFSSFDTAASPAGFVLVWSQANPPIRPGALVSDVMFAPYSVRFVPRQDAAIVSMGVASQASPVAAFGGGAYLVAWSERNGPRWQLRAQKFGLGGETVGPQIILPFSIKDQIAPAIAFNGESFLLVWSEGPNGRSAIRGTRITADGTVLDLIAMVIAGPASRPQHQNSDIPRTADVAWSGNSWVIASEAANVIELRRIAANGIALNSGPRVMPQESSSGGAWTPVVDCAAGGPCLVAWHSLVPFACPGILCPPWADSIVAIRVSNDLQLLDALPQTVGPPHGTRRNVAVSWNEAQDAWLVVWSGPAGRRISRSGVILDPAQTHMTGSDYFVSAAADGLGWRLIWSSNNSTGSVGVLTAFTTTGFTPSQLVPRRLAAPKNGQLEVFAVEGPRPLGLFVRVEPDFDDVPRIFGRFFDEAESFPTRRRSVRR